MKVGDIWNHINQYFGNKVIKGNILKIYEVNQRYNFTKHLHTKRYTIITFIATVADTLIE